MNVKCLLNICASSFQSFNVERVSHALFVTVIVELFSLEYPVRLIVSLTSVPDAFFTVCANPTVFMAEQNDPMYL